MREFLRHPSDIPVDVKILREDELRLAQLKDVGSGGVCCRVARPIREGCQVEFAVPSLCSGFTGRGVVVWCQAAAENFQVGIQFLNRRDRFQARLVEQLSQIEHFRREMEISEGRFMDGEQAAKEWIARHAEEFDRQFPLA